jgi:hypothetical protein
MNLGNLKKSAEEALKKAEKGGKNLFAAAIIASLTACGPSDKKAETTTPTDSTKTEVVAKDSIKKVDNSTEKDTKEKEINSIEDLDPELQAMIKDADIKLEEENLAEEKHAVQNALNQAQEMYERYLNLCKMQENTILESYREAGQNEEVIAELKEIIKEYHKNREKINRPIPPKVQKVINICEKKKG